MAKTKIEHITLMSITGELFELRKSYKRWYLNANTAYGPRVLITGFNKRIIIAYARQQLGFEVL